MKRHPRSALLLLVLCAAGCPRSAPPAGASAPASAGPASPSAGPAGPAELGDHDADMRRAATLLGGERGLDHVGIAVTDLAAATHTFHDVLGFSRPSEGRLPNGIANVNYYFADSSYLETMTPWDAGRAAWLAAFLKRHEGAAFAVLSIHDAVATSAFLGARGIRVGPPFDGTITVVGGAGADAGAPGDERWQTLFLPDGQLPGDPLYFIAYPRAPREAFLARLQDRGARRQLYHDNTALGLRAVWIAVEKLDEAVRAYEAVGLPRLRAFRDAPLSAEGVALAAGPDGGGEIWLLAPASTLPRTAQKKGAPVGAIRRFLDERGGSGGVLGVTLMAGSVPAAARLLAERTGRALPIVAGPLGDSVRIPPELAHGCFVELLQYLVPPRP